VGDQIYLESVAEDYGIAQFGVECMKAMFFDVRDKKLRDKEISYHGFNKVKINTQC